jgi:uncharacterized protein with NRDE domain
MCLIVFALDAHPRYRLVLAANRDEYFTRPTAPAGFWPEAPQLLAGRDLQGGGSWLGITSQRRLAAITNYRDPLHRPTNPPSRGRLVTGFLTGTETPAAFLEMLAHGQGRYGGFNLLVGDDDGLFWHSNRGSGPQRIPAGIHGLSNHLLDTPWPKVTAAKAWLAELLTSGQPDMKAMFAALADTRQFPDPLLPDTGVGLDRERILSPIFIAGDTYGTRSTTLILIDRDNRVTFAEQCYDSRQQVTATTTVSVAPDGSHSALRTGEHP